jgi:hypothetical protein
VEIDGGCEAGICFVVTGGDLAELLDPPEKGLDQVSPLIRFLHREEWALCDTPWLGSQQPAPRSLSMVRNALLSKALPAMKIDARDQRFDADAVVTLAGQQDTLEFHHLPRAPKGPECLRW